MITARRGQSSHHKLLRDNKIDSRQQSENQFSVNQFVTIKYRYALASIFSLLVSILLLLSISDAKKENLKLLLGGLALLFILLSFMVLSRSTRTVSNNDIHNTDE